MSATDLDDVGEGLGLGVHVLGEEREAREEVFVNRKDGRDVHGRGEAVVGALRAVDVIVRVNVTACKRLVEELDRAVGQHLVHYMGGKEILAHEDDR